VIINWRRAALIATSATGAAVLIGLVLPSAVGSKWGAISAFAAQLSILDIGILFAVWLGGLAIYGAVQATALPGLGFLRGMLLNFVGSCVSNVVPFGGVAGTGVNLAMTRRWKYGTSAFVRFVAVTHLLNIVAKLALPALALAALLMTGTVASGSLIIAASIASAALLCLLALVGVVLATESSARALGAATQPLADIASRLIPRLSRVDTRHAFTEFRLHTADLLRGAWGRLTAGMLGYSGMQFLLFLLCLRMIGLTAPIPVVLAAFAMERTMTLVVITPGGLGLAETMSTLVLVALHVDPVASAAGVVIYRAFTYLFEIPVGGVWLIGWWISRVRARQSGPKVQLA
jgi:uncharacterized membrane protein YbhN (UPF0104 family)